MGLFSRLGDVGLENMESANLFEEKETKEPDPAEVASKEREEKVISENDFLIERKRVCPVCKKTFKHATIKTGRVKLLSTELDLRGIYQGIDPNKYQVVACPICGYSSLINNFDNLSTGQIKLIRTNIYGKVMGIEEKVQISYDDAIIRYQIALACAIVKKAKDSEKAYLALRMAWVLRGGREEYALQQHTDEVKGRLAQMANEEKEALNAAYEGFVKARASEFYPIAGMDEHTLDYLIAALAFEVGKYREAYKLLGAVLTSRSAPKRIKDKANELKDKIIVKIHEEADAKS